MFCSEEMSAAADGEKASRDVCLKFPLQLRGVGLQKKEGKKTLLAELESLLKYKL